MTSQDKRRVQKIRLDVDSDTQATLDRLMKQLHDRLPRNVLRSAYYDGRKAAQAMTAVVPPQYNALGLVLGWCAKSVDLLGRRCNLDGFAWPDGNLDNLGYAELMTGNALAGEIDQAIVSSLEHGVAFAITTAGEGDEPAGLIQFRDATQATGEWNERARRLDNLLVITGYGKDGNISGLVLYLPGRTIEATRKPGGGWLTSEQTHSWGVPAEPLVYRPRLSRRFGSSRITRPCMKLQDAAVRTLVRLEGHMDIYSYPEMWLLGADPKGVFKNEDGTVKAPWQVMLGRIKGIPDDDEAENPRADIRQFNAQSPAPHLADINALAKLFAREASLPDSSLAITDMANPTSADAYDASQYDLIAEAEGATDGWDMAVRRTFLRSLAMQNGLSEIPQEWASITTRWRNPRFLSRSAEADAGMKQLSAVPWLAETEVGLELLGLTDSQRARALGELQRSRSAQMLATLTGAAAGGGTPDPAAQASAVKAQADALGALIRSGVDPVNAAQQVGMAGVEFTGAVPVSLRLPEAEAGQLEQA